MSHYTGKPRVRTVQQNKALHKFYELLADELNSAGYTVQLFLKEAVDLDWDKNTVKELIWRPLQKALVRKGSTTELDKVTEIGLIYEHLNRHIGEKFGIHVPWPHIPKDDIAPLINR